MLLVHYSLLSICGLVLVSAYYESAVDDLCLGRDDVIFARSCKTYLKCVNGTAVTFHCDQYMVFNMNSGNCEYAFNVHSPCGVFRDCTKLPDGHFPDTEHKCMRFYTCWKKSFLGFNSCSMGLVFNVRKQVCDWPFNVMEPCGIR
ncbi:uncharacterized protein LOC128189328 [Crassostrea angulata]|uniref:Chitin-binding type-2 domain-containing protein n=1 Tax=Magallana gigas TaxID=29159 RepID=A0A8W8K9X4_MAGGI|nr:uncharacterized protein LOC105317661 [Crassostrea gigas]XP_052716851.1 uncharacterized protein LOC128189328 [Crassostrea angulata]|eukprot:XP_011412674.1 PREDICTED: uncharacterized protein LOC105317661 [Crassostrea gigas]